MYDHNLQLVSIAVEIHFSEKRRISGLPFQEDQPRSDASSRCPNWRRRIGDPRRGAPMENPSEIEITADKTTERLAAYAIMRHAAGRFL